MQKIATRVFICASVVFGVIGLIFAFTGKDPDTTAGGWQAILARVFMASVFVILTSFALSVAGKYLGNGKS